MFDLSNWAIRAKCAFMKTLEAMADFQMKWRPAVRQRKHRGHKKPDQWDFREYAGGGFGWF